MDHVLKLSSNSEVVMLKSSEKFAEMTHGHFYKLIIRTGL